ncbi:CRISPR system Cascade subunit CasD [Microbacterium resistens]|uniref:CRISPR system Cascade subunit CasD n=1 Tax=Microbacterium resistens TaxID=156977 RepID=A0ABU1SC00_9MICO|nr:type I-E CRISPR-associated protein Cas5/CasD [Microbacterium resistens]MDR6867118.1 CRISPR system Cascade subunit CasD [Microbacterium resistens]
MTTLLLELSGPQQAWGSRSRYATRATELAPTRSGVIGLFAAALGMERTEPLDRFRDLRIGVRLDQPGTLERDFQTARSFDGSTSYPLSQRYYLADAVFLVGVEGPSDELVELRAAIARPYFPLFLGRRAFPPSGPILTELVDAPLNDALRDAPWRARPHHRRTHSEEKVSLSTITDRAAGEPSGETRQDVPESFDPRRRRYSARDVTIRRVLVDHPDPRPGGGRSSVREGLLGSPTDHDPFSLLSDEEI